MPFEQSDWCPISKNIAEILLYIPVYWNLHCCSGAMDWVNCQTCDYHCPITVYHMGSDTL